MAVRSLFGLVVVIAGQPLAGCGVPDEGGMARDSRAQVRKAELTARNAKVRGQIEKGTFGLAQLFPGGKSADARQLPPVTRPSTAAPVAAFAVPAPRLDASTQPMRLASTAAPGYRDSCVYKPVMSDADIDACR